MKKFIVDKEVWDILPNMTIGILVLDGVKENKKLSEEALKEIETLLNNANKES